MGVLADYECMAHGRFESYFRKCPQGCDISMVKKVFLKAPGFHSDRTKNIDKTVRDLAADYGLTDLNNQNGTSAVVRPDARKTAERDQLMGKLGDTSGAWGSMPSGGSTSIQSALAAAKAAPGNALEAIKPSLTPPKPLVVARHDAKIEA